ncbi:MAG: serine hydroxymethyltransferase [Thiotrichales bacterium]|nr:MAG: serine hydroxymethyltransferase [Thiotrichales bacterium]
MIVVNVKDFHDASALKNARALMRSCKDNQALQDLITTVVEKNKCWRGQECINLLAAESPTSPTVRSLLSAEVGTRAASGHIGAHSRWVKGTRYIDQLEALSLEYLKQLFKCDYAEHRLLGGTIACHVVYAALTQPGDTIMSFSPAVGGDSSNRKNGPPGVLRLNIIDIPFDNYNFNIDMGKFLPLARKHKPKLVSLGLGMTLFSLPLKSIRDVISEWGGILYYDAAHQLGLIAGGVHQDPFAVGTDVVSGSTGKTFSGPQGGLLLWNHPKFTKKLINTVFPVFVGTHQINRVAALAVATAESIAFGNVYMQQVVRNAKALARALDAHGIPVMCAHKDYTETHQIIIDVSQWGSGDQVACCLESCNIIVNTVQLPASKQSNGIRIGVVEITRLGMREAEMIILANLITQILIEKKSVKIIALKVIELRKSFQKIHYCFD